MKTNLIFLVRDAFATFSWRVPLLVSLIVFSGLLEGVSITLALPLLAAMGQGQGDAGGASEHLSFVGRLPSAFGLTNDPIGVGILMIGLLAVSSVALLLQARLAASMQVNYVLRWQNDLFRTSIEAGPRFLNDRRGGDVVAGLVQEASRISGAFYHVCLASAAVVNVAIYFSLALMVSGYVTVAIGVLGVILLIVTRPFLRRAYGFGKAISEAQGDIQSLSSEYIAQAKVVKANAAERFVENRFGKAANQLAVSNFKNSFDIQIAKTVFEFGGAAGIATVLIGGPLFFSIDVGTIIVVIALFVRLLPRITGLQQGVQAMSSLLPALGNLSRLLADAREHAEQIDDSDLPGAISQGATSIRFSGTSIRRGGKVILKAIDLDFPSGKVIGLVGPSGSGKSTIVDAILGLIPISDGEITICGHDVASLPLQTWRRSIGYVGQDTALFSGTISENVQFGTNATSADVERALKKAEATFVFGNALGVDATVGDRGARVSGGERQRIGLARALVVPRRLYILDEATSALDSEMEAEIVQNVAVLAGEATVIVIAHRYTAVRGADLIYFVEDGRAVESGDWNTLDRPGTRFHTMKQLQLMDTGNAAEVQAAQ